MHVWHFKEIQERTASRLYEAGFLVFVLFYFHFLFIFAFGLFLSFWTDDLCISLLSMACQLMI